jgi:hypothetical protein
MKKLLLFISLVSVINAESKLFEGIDLERIAKESAERTNLKFADKEKELLSIPEEIYEIKSLEKGKKDLKKIQEITDNYSNKKGNYSISYGLSTNHVKYGNFKNEYEFNEKNNLITLEYRLKNDSLGIATFENSFYNQSYAVYYGHYSKLTNKLELNYKVGICKGYNSEDSLLSEDGNRRIYFNNETVFYKDYSVLATIGLQYSFSNHLSVSCDLLGNAIESSVKYTF